MIDAQSQDATIDIELAADRFDFTSFLTRTRARIAPSIKSGLNRPGNRRLERTVPRARNDARCGGSSRKTAPRETAARMLSGFFSLGS
jgi:hypothetical protein